MNPEHPRQTDENGQDANSENSAGSAEQPRMDSPEIVNEQKFKIEGTAINVDGETAVTATYAPISNADEKREEQKKYKEEQKERMRTFVVGCKNKTGNTVTKIFSKADEWVVYEIETNNISDSIKVEIDTQKEEDETLTKRLDGVRINFSKVKGLLYKVNDDTSIKGRVAQLISHALCGDPMTANNEFAELMKEINTSYSEQFNNRLRYLMTILGVTILLVLASIAIYVTNSFQNIGILRSLVFVVTAGAIGGFLSVSRRLKRTVFEKDVKQWLYIAYGIERVFIAIMGATTLFFAIKSNLAFGIANELERPNMAYAVFSIVAGFSETLIPNLLVKLESENK